MNTTVAEPTVPSIEPEEIEPDENAAPNICGAKVTSLEGSEITSLLAWLFDSSTDLPTSFAEGNTYYAVLQCCDSLVWGVYTADRWRWANDVDAGIRKPERVTLLEARVFGAEAEALLWRIDPFDPPQFQGRLAQEGSPPQDALCKPLVRTYPFEVQGVTPLSDDFVQRKAGGGNIVVTPPGNGIEAREYLQRCEQTGVLRIALTRFVGIEQQPVSGKSNKEK